MEIDFDAFRLIVLASFSGTLLAMLVFSSITFFSRFSGDGYISAFFLILFTIGIMTVLAWPALSDVYEWLRSVDVTGMSLL